MTSKKYFYILCGAFALTVVLIIGGAVGGNFLLEKKSKQLTDLKIKNKVLESQQTALLQAKIDIEKYSELDTLTKAIVPQDKDQAKTVREIVQIAQINHIPIKSVTFQSSTLGTGTTTTTAPASGTTAAAPKTSTPAISQLKAVDGIKGVYTFEIKVESANPVAYQDVLNFLSALENNRRTAHVTAIALNPSEKNRNLLDFSLTLNAYVKP